MTATPPTYCEFVRHLGVVLEPAQAVYAAVAFDRVPIASLSSNETDLAGKLFGFVGEVPPEACDTVALVKGARVGGTYLCALRVLHLALTVPLTSLAPGETASAPIVGPDTRLARLPLRYILGAVKRVPWLVRLVVNETGDTLTIQRPDGRVAIEVLPASRGGSALRGRSLVAAMLSEASFFRDADFVVNDEELYRAVAPRVMAGGQTIIESTPWVQSGLLYQFFTSDFGKPSTALVARAPTRVMRTDSRTLALVDREEKRNPANALREFGAEFAAASQAAFDADELSRLVTSGVASRPWKPEISYGLVFDIGLRHDATAAIVFHRKMRTAANGQPLDVLVIDAVLHLQPAEGQRLELEQVVQQLIALARKYRVRTVHGDRHLSDGAKPLLQRAGIKLVELGMTVKEQAARAEQLMARVTSGALVLVDHPALVAELRKVQLKRRAGGGFVVEAFGRGHDDLADCVLGMNDPVFSKLAPTFADGRGGTLKKTPVRHWWNEAGLTVSGGDYYRELPDGSLWPADMPVSDRRFLANAREQIRNGCWTKTVEGFVAGLGLRAVPAVAEFLDCPELAPPELRLK